jgi:hypothetical protein
MDEDSFTPEQRRLIDELTRAQYSKEVHPNPDHPTRRAARVKDQPIYSAPRQAGKATNQLNLMASNVGRHNLGRPTPDLRELDALLGHARGGAVVVWTSNHRYTYAAVHAAGRWFITGRGDYYKGNEFTHDEFVYQVLGHHDVTSIYLTSDFTTLFTR